MTNCYNESQQIILNSEEFERLEQLRFKAQQAESLVDLKFYHEQINTILTRGRRRKLERESK